MSIRRLLGPSLVALIWLTVTSPAAAQTYDEDCRGCDVLHEQAVKDCNAIGEVLGPIEKAKCLAVIEVEYAECLMAAWFRHHLPKKPCRPTDLESGDPTDTSDCSDDDGSSGGGGDSGGGNPPPACHQDYVTIEEDDGYGWYTIWEGWVTVCG